VSDSAAPPEVELSADVARHTDDCVALAATASAAYDAFVFHESARAEGVARFLFDRGIAEFSPPAVRLLLSAGRPVGMFALLPAELLRKRRLAATWAITREPSLGVDADALRRLKLAAGTLMRVEDGDAYLARIAVHPDASGRGLGQLLLQEVVAESRRIGAARCVLDVATDNDRSIALYRRAGFAEVGRADVEDVAAGRTLGHLHLALTL
jgi:GNAT superfamily N-acetyltransferase